MKTAPAFIDSNVLIYAASDDPRAAIAEGLMTVGCVTSVQALNEFATVARRKLKMSWVEVRSAIDVMRVLFRVIAPIDLAIHTDGLRLAERYGFAFYDALMIASALRLECKTFWSEDMQHGMVVDKTLIIKNPFK
ncbi:PIN domain-containing protein [Beijerinckia sp. L45]|uniref:PIN domain-containing protein n=1 Tax=Beijerinckia sp. L45 TaxID=1641855 RepID=UPI00131A79A4|nr:PIN domain-containing protein [Beijerinckia sp. L45]